MRPIKNPVVQGFPIKIIEWLVNRKDLSPSYPDSTFKFETCWLCHKPIALVYMCDECWQKSPEEVRGPAERALKDALKANSRVIYQFSPTSYKIGE